MIRLVNITKKYSNTVLDNITLNMYENNIYLIKGISGSGKTTLLNIIGGIDDKYDGDYFLDSQNVRNLNGKERKQFSKRIGYIFQKSLLISHLNILDNLLFIKNDKELIIKLSYKFKVNHLLDKMPNELSGGERQRIAIIRVLLLDPDIIIADEPTASLDYNNAVEFVKYLKMIKNRNKIIIITSHSNVFDSISDEIIELKYGKASIKKVAKIPQNILDEESVKKVNKNIFSNVFLDIKYSICKRKNLNKIISILFISFIIFISLIAVSLKINFERAYKDYIKSTFPINTFSVSKHIYDLFIDNNIEMQTYENYSYSIDGVEYLPLFAKENTILSNENYLAYGKFPDNNNEVLVNYKYITDVLKKKEIEIGESIVIDNINFLIVGVISNDLTYMNDIYNSNSYYNYSDNPQVFVPYANSKEIFNKQSIGTNSIMVTVKDYSDDVQDIIYSVGETNYWDKKVSNIKYSLFVFLDIFFVVLGVFAFLIIIFVTNHVLLDLFYRKKEIGYLQLFGVDKKRLKFILLIEYLIKYIIALIIAVIIYYISIKLIKELFLINIVLKLNQIIFCAVLIILYLVLILYIPLSLYLRRNIKELIYT